MAADKGRGVLQCCAAGAPAELTAQLQLLAEDGPEHFVSTLHGSILQRLAQVPHQRPTEMAATMQALADAASKLQLGGPANAIPEAAVRWLIEAQGGPGRDARDTGTRWRLCTMLRGFLLALRPPPALPAKLQADIDATLLARVRDRSSDVRLAAVQALVLYSLRAAGASEAALERALGDCDAQVRAAALQALFAGGAEVPQLLHQRARLDTAPRVRRALLGAIFDRMEDERSEWEPEWRDAILLGLGDRTKSARLAAADAALAAAGRGWLPEIFQDPQLVSDVALQLAAAFADLIRQDAELKALKKFLAPGPAISALAQESSPQRAVFARVAYSVAAMLGEPAALGGAAALVRRAWRRGNMFEMKQLLLVLLTGELPPETAGRAKLVQTASEVLAFAPVEDMAQELLQLGAFPERLLGPQLQAPPGAMTLAMLLLRRVAGEDGQRVAVGLPRSSLEVEARFSRMASNVVKAMLRKIADLEEGAEEPTEAGGLHSYNDLVLRTVFIASAWISLSRVPLARDQAQRLLLEEVLRPAVKSAELGHAGQVAAIQGIALYASKTAEQAVAHWSFFIGLLEANLPSLYAPWSLASGQGLPLCAVARLAELALLFLTDAVLLYSEQLLGSACDQVFLALAKVLAALDHAATRGEVSSYFRFLRTVACDRACTLLVMGRSGASTAAMRWVLGHLLADVCGVGAPHPPAQRAADAASSLHDPHGYSSLVPYSMQKADEEPEPADDRRAACTEHAVLCSRLLRFFAMLPSLSPAHAELLALAAEAFFGSRMWTLAPAREAAGSRVCPAVRAARLTCSHLRTSSELQLRVLRAVGAARLTVPKSQEVMLSDALVAACLAAAGGGPPLGWVGEGAMDVGEALAALLANWVPQSSAQLVRTFVGELHAHAAAADGGWAWAQPALAAAAELRHDLGTLALSSSLGSGFDPSLGAQEPPTLKTPAKAARPVPAAEAAADAPEAAVPAPKRARATEDVWMLVDCGSGQRFVLAEGSEVTTIGRMAKCEVAVQNNAVSGRHCAISCSRFGLQLEDLSTTNGTFVNDRRVLPGASVVLKAGDVIALAARTGQRFTLQRGPAPSSGGPAEGPQSPQEPLDASPEKASRPRAEAEVEAELNPAKRRRLRAKTTNPPWDVANTAVKVAKAEPSAEPCEEEPPQALATTPAPRRRLRAKTSGAAWDAGAAAAAAQAKDTQEAKAAKEAHVVEVEAAEAAKPHEPQLLPDEPELTAEERVALAVFAAVHDHTATAPRLVRLSSGEVQQLPRDGVFTMGRRYDCDLAIQDPDVSSRHCVLYCSGGAAKVEDLSSNGTYVNETRVPKGFALPQHVALMQGDRLTLARRDGPSWLFVPPAGAAEASDEDEE